jgi:hypothetical protein
MNVERINTPKYAISDLDRDEYDNIIRGLKAVEENNIVVSSMIYHLELMRGENV